MFEKFGEFDSAQEINAAAEGLKKEGDLESLKALAVENGLDPEDAEDYAAGDMDELVNPVMAALGKLEVENKELKLVEIMADWLEYIKICVTEQPAMAISVRKKGKSLKGCIAELLKWSFKNQIDVPKDVIKAAGINGKVTMGIPGMGRVKEIIQEYYAGKQVGR